MRTNKRALTQQRKILSKKIVSSRTVWDLAPPPSGWLRAVRGALGLTTRQLAALLGTNHAGVIAMEKREVTGKVSLETLQKAAQAMGCRFVYAVVPEEPNRTLDDILDARAARAAKRILSRLEHSMRLEKQGTSNEELAEEIETLAAELKASLDPRLWDMPPKKKEA